MRLYVHLLEAMRRHGVHAGDVADAAGMTGCEAWKILKGRGSFEVTEAFQIRRQLFPAYALEWLFERRPQP